MKRITSLILFFLITLDTSIAFAWNVLIVQSFRTRPYSEVVRGFKSSCPAKIWELVLSELNGSDPLREIRRLHPDLIVATGADSLQTVKKIRDIPIIYCMVLSPDNVIGNEDNITGISMNIPPEVQLSMLIKALPHLRKVGMVYNPVKTGAIVEKAISAADRNGIRVIALKAEKARDLPRQLRNLPDGLDAYWMLPDSTFTVPEAVESLIYYSMQKKVPIFSFSEKYLRMGAFMSMDLDPYLLGRQAGEMAERIRAGVEVAAIPRTDADRSTPTINRGIAAKLGITINAGNLKKFRFINKEQP